MMSDFFGYFRPPLLHPKKLDINNERSLRLYPILLSDVKVQISKIDAHLDQLNRKIVFFE